jgi:hypothetical protein
MFERRMTVDEVCRVIERDDVIDMNQDDLPYPSRLLLGRAGGRVLHVVVADNRAGDELIVVTAYEPDPALWQRGFRRRRQA